MVERGDVWLAVLEPTLGNEIRKTRPCLVVSPDELNRVGHTFLAVPLTTGSRSASFRPETMFKGRRGRVLTDQIRTFDRSRFLKKLGRIDGVSLAATLKALRNMFTD